MGHHTRLDYALAAAQRGWHVFPLLPGDKHPLKGRSWKPLASTDPQRIRRYWAHGGHNIGIATDPSGLVVLDLDLPKGGDQPPPEWDGPGIAQGIDVLAILAERHGERLPLDTFTVTTRRGGLHLYFTAPHEVKLPNTTGTLGWLIDTRASGGYVVAPGSYVDLDDGAGPYTVTNPTPPARLPDWLTRLLTPPPPVQHRNLDPLLKRISSHRTGYAGTALHGEVQRVLDAREGTRNAALNAAAFALGQLTAAGLLPEDLVHDCLTAAATHIGLPAQETAATIGSGLRSGARSPRTSQGGTP